MYNKKKAFKVEVEAYTQSNNPMWDDVELDEEESFEESYDTLEEAIENLRDVSKDIGWLGCYVTGSINKKEYISLEYDEDILEILAGDEDNSYWEADTRKLNNQMAMSAMIDEKSGNILPVVAFNNPVTLNNNKLLQLEFSVSSTNVVELIVNIFFFLL